MTDINELLKQKLAQSSAVEITGGKSSKAVQKAEKKAAGKEDEWKASAGEYTETVHAPKVLNVKY